MIKIELNLSDEDLKILLNALERYVSDLSVEIAHTDTKDFREGLKSERTSIQNVLDQIKAKAIK